MTRDPGGNSATISLNVLLSQCAILCAKVGRVFPLVKPPRQAHVPAVAPQSAV